MLLDSVRTSDRSSIIMGGGAGEVAADRIKVSRDVHKGGREGVEEIGTGLP